MPLKRARYQQEYDVNTPAGSGCRSCPPGSPAGTKIVAGVKIRTQIKPQRFANPGDENAPAATICRRRRVPAFLGDG